MKKSLLFNVLVAASCCGFVSPTFGAEDDAAPATSAAAAALATLAPVSEADVPAFTDDLETEDDAADAREEDSDSDALFELPEEFADPIFERYIDLRSVRTALTARDTATLTDLALQLAEGERILQRKHRSGLSAAKLMSKAAALATDKRDQTNLNRLLKAAEIGGRAELVAEIKASQKLSGESRAVDPAFVVSVESTDVDALSDLKGWLDTVGKASLLGDGLALAALDQELDASTRLSKEQVQAIKKLIERGILDAKQQDAEDPLLIKLAGASRADSDRQSVRDRIEGGGWTIVWGKTVAAREYAELAASIYSGTVGAYFSYLLEQNVEKMKKQLPGVATSTIRQAVLRAIKGEGVVRVGKFGIKGGVATYRYWNTITVDVPDGTEKYKIKGPLGSWTWGYRAKTKRITRQVPAEPNNHQPYFGFRIY